MNNIVTIYASKWLEDNNIHSEEVQEQVLKFAHQIDIMLIPEKKEKKNGN